jgi:DNA mismatch repair protein MLH1
LSLNYPLNNFADEIVHLFCSEELFYQLILYDFANFGLIKAGEPVSLYGLMDVAMEYSDEPMTDPMERAAVLEQAVSLLMSKAEMLADYFSLQFSQVISIIFCGRFK